MTNARVDPKDETFGQAIRRIGAVLKSQWDIDRTGLTPQPKDYRASAAAWASIIGVYVLGWGESTLRALSVVLDWEGAPTGRPVGTVPGRTADLIMEVAVASTAAAFIWAFRRYGQARHIRPASWRTSLWAFPVYYMAVVAGMLTTGLISAAFGLPDHDFHSPVISEPLLRTLNVLLSGMAGPAEELALLALVVVALRATGHSWRDVIITAMIVRVPFHLMYGWGAVGLAVWAALAVLLYKRTGAIVAIIFGHATWNMLLGITAGSELFTELAGLLQYVIGITGGLFLLVLLIRALKV